MLVRTAAIYFFCRFLHAAFATGFGSILCQAPIGQLAHTIMHMYCGARGGADVQYGYYGR